MLYQFIKDLVAALVMLAPDIFSFLKAWIPRVSYIGAFTAFQKQPDGSYIFVFRLHRAAPPKDSVDSVSNRPPDGFYDVPFVDVKKKSSNEFNDKPPE